MRLRDLQLRAFGCFTNVTLDFSSESQTFHVIYGSNEAGKSTALRALEGFLYRIPRDSSDAYAHDTKNLRVAAQVVDGTGRAVTFIRRKGNKDTLLGTDDRPIADTALERLLGKVTQDSFGNLFRLDHVALRDAGSELAKSDLGKSLFEAGTGLGGLRNLLETLEGEANAIYRSSGHAKNPPLNQALAEYRKRQQEAIDLSTPAEEFERLSRDLSANEGRLAELRAEIAELRQCKSRLDRYGLGLSHLSKRTSLLATLRDLGDTPRLDEDAPKRREAAESERRMAQRSRDEASEELAKLKARLAELGEPGAVLSEADAVKAIRDRVQEYRNAKRDLPVRIAELEGFEAAAREHLADIGREATLADAAASSLSRATRESITKLVHEHAQLTERRKNGAAAANAQAVALARERQTHAAQEVPRDLANLRRAIEAAQSLGDVDEQLRDARRKLDELEELAALMLKRLPLWKGSLEALETLAVPTDETIARFAREFDSLARDAEGLDQKSREVEADTDKFITAVRSLEMSAPVPTEEDLRLAREARDVAWERLRDDLLAEPDARSSPRADTSARAQAFERCVRDADSVADRLRREADRVAKVAGLKAELETRRKRAGELSSQRKELDAKRADRGREWDEVVRATLPADATPDELRGWLSRRAEIVARVGEARERRREHNRLTERVTEHRKRLLAAVAELGGVASAAEGELQDSLRVARATLGECEKKAGERARIESEVKRLTAAWEEAEANQRAIEREVGEWERRWSKAVEPLSLGNELAPDAAAAVLDGFRQIQDALKNAKDRAERVAAMKRSVEEIGAEVDRLARMARITASEQPDKTAIALDELLSEEERKAARRRALSESIETNTAKLEQAERDLAHATSELSSLFERAGVADLPALEEAERRSRTRASAEFSLAEIDDQLRAIAAGAPLEEFLGQLEEVALDELPARIAECQAELSELDERRSELDRSIGQLRAKKDAIDGASRAQEAAEEAQGQLARARDLTEQYLRLQLAHRVLDRHVEGYRQRNQNPILARASGIFAALTLGSFAALEVDVEDGKPALLGVRPAGDRVGVAGMSDGTCDQLFLSLRLASLERHLDSEEPFPLVVDDILVNFDDQRAAATLAQLGNLATRTQVLFFTHHERLVELAEKNVPEGRLKVHRLERPRH